MSGARRGHVASQTCRQATAAWKHEKWLTVSMKIVKANQDYVGQNCVTFSSRLCLCHHQGKQQLCEQTVPFLRVKRKTSVSLSSRGHFVKLRTTDVMGTELECWSVSLKVSFKIQLVEESSPWVFSRFNPLKKKKGWRMCISSCVTWCCKCKLLGVYLWLFSLRVGLKISLHLKIFLCLVQLKEPSFFWQVCFTFVEKAILPA